MIKSKIYHPLNLIPFNLLRLVIGFALLFLGNSFSAQLSQATKDSLSKISVPLSEVKNSALKKESVNNNESSEALTKTTASKKYDSESTIYITDGTSMYGFDNNQFANIVNLKGDNNQKILAKGNFKKKKLQQEKNILSKKEYKNPIFKKVFNYHSTENNSQFSSRDISRKIAVVPNIHSQNKQVAAIFNDFQNHLFSQSKVERILFTVIFFEANRALEKFYTRPPPFRI